MIGYGEQVLDHYRHPRNEGSLPAPQIRHEDLNPLCGDRVRIELELEEGERVGAAKFRADGCILCRAACSILTEQIAGSALSAIEGLETAGFIGSLQVDLRPARVRCVVLPLEVLRAGIAAYRRGKVP
ncbi:MAG TPA: iron-sulfur cluster assembly scaffold protein [Candidatus Manganitrophaceae bacterium]|nr:iron-sulfur cluster assembly scaffold protein [Candidatus Manganitrophaceae bacterium]